MFMPAKSILLLLSLMAVIGGFSQDTLFWKPGYRLTWNDFMGKPDLHSNYLALSSAGISYNLFYNSNSIQVNAKAFFVKSGSWRKPAADSILLRHEQGHFDITEIYRRKLVQTAKEIPAGVPEKAAWVIEKADKIIKQKNAYQLQYDSETRNGTDKKKQEQWLATIQQLLQEGAF
jgi:hypothetical protein